jgi:uncharacterized beta-barrel protein YwiB (DUF1934 family)
MSKTTKALIDILGKQTDENGQDDVIEMSVQGTVTRHADGSVEIVYRETPMTGMEETETRLLVQGERISMFRSGQYHSTMVFERNVKYMAMYQTPFGAFSMSILPTRVEAHTDDTTAHLFINYDYGFGPSGGQNRLEIKAKNL